MLDSLVAPFAFAAGVSSMLVPAVRTVAVRIGFMDVPGDRKVHSRPIPYLGGLALVIGCVGAIVAVGSPTGESLVMVLGAGLLAIVGMLDDRFALPIVPRIGAEAIAALAAVLAGVRIDLTGFAPYDIALTLLWIVGITNAINMVDNIDGLSGGLTAAGAAGIAVLAGLQGQEAVAVSAAAITGTCIGFLMLNWHPACIFMGDSGAMFLGFAIAVTSIEVTTEIASPGSSLVPFLVLGVPLVDVTLVTIERIRHGRKPYVGGKDHLSHRLRALGLSVPAAVSALIGLQVALSALAVVVGRDIVGPYPTLVGGGALAALAAVALRAKVYPEPAVHRRVSNYHLSVLTVGVLLLASVPQLPVGR